MTLQAISSDSTDPVVVNRINQLSAALYQLTNANISPTAAIDMSKIDFSGVDLMNHGGNHSGTTGNDPLPAEGIITSNLANRCVTSPKLAIGCVMPEHWADGAISAGFYVDSTPLTISNAETVPALDGYTYWFPMIIHYYWESFGTRNEYIHNIGFTLAAGAWTAQISIKLDDGSTVSTGTITYIRVGIK